MALQVWCHECGGQHTTNPNITNGVLRCPSCLSEFAELHYDPARRTPAPPVNQDEDPPSSSARPPSPPPPSNLRSLLQQQLTGRTGQAGGTAHVEGQTFGPSSQSRTHRFRDPNSGTNVEVHVTTTPVTPDMLRGGFPMALPAGHTMMLTMPVDVALAGFGGLFPGMEGGALGTENFDQILTHILNQYQPAAQPAARSVVERLPRRRVRGEHQQNAPQPSHHHRQQQQQQQQQQQEERDGERWVRREGTQQQQLQEGQGAQNEAAGPRGAAAAAEAVDGVSAPAAATAAAAAAEGAEGPAGAGGRNKGEGQGHQSLSEHTGSDGRRVSRDKSTREDMAGSKAPAGRDGRGESQAKEAQAGEDWARCQAGEPCSVCLSLFSAGEVAVELPCGHDFHEGCILPWLQEHHTCPTCRGPLPMEDEARPSVSAADIRDAAQRTVQRQNSAEVPPAHPPAHASHSQPQNGGAAGEAGFTHYPELAQAQNNLAQRLHSVRTRVRALRRRQAGGSDRETPAQANADSRQRGQDTQGSPSFVSVQAMEEEIRQLEEEELRPLEEDVQQEQQRDLEQRERERGRQQQQQQQQQRLQQQGDRNQGTPPHPLMGLDVSWGPMLSFPSFMAPSLLEGMPSMGGHPGSNSSSGGGGAFPFGNFSTGSTPPARTFPSPPSLVLRGPQSIPAAAAPGAASAARRRAGVPSEADTRSSSSSSGGRGAASARIRTLPATASGAARATPAPQEEHPHAPHHEEHHHVSFGWPPFLGLPFTAPEPPAVSLVSRIPLSPFPAADMLPVSDEPQAFEVPTLAPIRLRGRITQGSTNQGSTASSTSIGAGVPRPRYTAGGNSRGANNSSNNSGSSASRGAARDGSDSSMRGLARGFLSSAGGTRPSERATRSLTTTINNNSTSTRPPQRSAAFASPSPSSSPSNNPRATQASPSAPRSNDGTRRSCKRTAEGEVVSPSSTPSKPTTCDTSTKALGAPDSLTGLTENVSGAPIVQQPAHPSTPQQAAASTPASAAATPAAHGSGSAQLSSHAAAPSTHMKEESASSTNTKEEPAHTKEELERSAVTAPEPPCAQQQQQQQQQQKVQQLQQQLQQLQEAEQQVQHEQQQLQHEQQLLQQEELRLQQEEQQLQRQQQQQQQEPMRRPGIRAALSAPLRWLVRGRLGRQQAATGGQQREQEAG